MMRYALGCLGLLILAGAAPAAATDWDSVAGWDVHEIDAGRCVIGRVFPLAGGTTFGIIMGLDGETRVFATSPRWSMRAGQPVQTRIGLDRAVVIDAGSVGMEQQGNRGFVAAAPPDFADRFAAASELAVWAGAGASDQRLPLTGSAAGLAQGRRCLANLAFEARNRPPAPRLAARPQPLPERRMASLNVSRPAFGAASRSTNPVTFAGRPIPRRPKSSWVEASDYPDAALRAEEEGSVTVKLAIGPSGGVEACDVVRSSGSSALDSTTCRIIQRRARYNPPVDTNGRAVAAVDQHTVRWALPE